MKLLKVLFRLKRFEGKGYRKRRIYFAYHSQIESGSDIGILSKQPSCTLKDDTIKGNVVMLFRLKITNNYFKYWQSWSRDLT